MDISRSILVNKTLIKFEDTSYSSHENSTTLLMAVSIFSYSSSISWKPKSTFSCHRGFLRPQWQICGSKICLFPQFTASFIIFLETILVFTIFNPKLMVFRSGKVPKVRIVHFFHFHIIVLNLPVCFKLVYWKLPSRRLTLKSSFVYFQFHLRNY